MSRNNHTRDHKRVKPRNKPYKKTTKNNNFNPNSGYENMFFDDVRVTEELNEQFIQFQQEWLTEKE